MVVRINFDARSFFHNVFSCGSSVSNDYAVDLIIGNLSLEQTLRSRTSVRTAHTAYDVAASTVKWNDVTNFVLFWGLSGHTAISHAYIRAHGHPHA
jgi:hypothetical protein